jgi:acetate kinase
MSQASRRELLVLNAGSSGFKFSLYPINVSGWSGPQCLGNGTFRRKRDGDHLTFGRPDSELQQEAIWPIDDDPSTHANLSRLMSWIETQHGWDIGAAVHRVVHGGDRQDTAVRIGPGVMADLDALTPLAPLHQAQCLAPIAWLSERHPALAQYACFDTAFHHTLDPLETSFGLPQSLTGLGLRRYGFHGLSYEYIASVLPQYDPRAAEGRTIVAHLGSGASLCGMINRVSRATTMGFSTLDGVLMATRPGRIDPGILLYLMREKGMGLAALEQLLYHECGLLGVSGGISGDVRELLASEAAEAKAAIDLFIRSVVREIGMLAAVLGGLDALVFTGGVGEHANRVRQGILKGCQWLGLQPRRDERTGPNRLSSQASGINAWVIATNENLVMARHALELISHAA